MDWTKSQLLTDAALDEIEAEALTNAAETYRGPLLALVGEVRRLRALIPEADARQWRRARIGEAGSHRILPPP